MKISKSEHMKFSQQFSIIEKHADDENMLTEVLEEMPLEDLEHLRAYLSGTMSLTPYSHIKSIFMYSFVGMSVIYLIFLYQTNTWLSFTAIILLLVVEFRLFQVAYSPPVNTHVILAHRRRKYDRIVQVIETILKKRYLKELQNAVINF
ncbi:hypothetical protein DUK53_01480 [Listeria sp. SHR_NRA_18]|uniref:hypothetical protein n=1 Tax=Listeria sp. SHR_NRA_18 TaxID=2269046 RepID=UPI00051D8CC5|nr:hypothetical protein [Listeria sp. SHR_NRA_18]KGL45293.1 hypothetical protein EP56_06975 [Listeriaceae bacterium FSL A5-0209]RQW68074.1 hypothetical protein DUK53_01480 [Listeria sp. SHR_NRA_18]